MGEITEGVDIQRLYLKYAFLDTSGNGEVEDCCSEAEGGATLEMLQLVDRSYEKPVKWFYVVFKPFDDAYAKDVDWFAIKGLDKCRKMFSSAKCYILTRETQAKKVHINALVATTQDLLSRHEKNYGNKYKLHVSAVCDRASRLTVLRYITKEAVGRTFVNYLDYLCFGK